MTNPTIYKGRGTPELYDDLMDFLNYVFGFNGNEQDFKKLLPKLYNPDCDPCYNNYVITENGRLKAAVGAFDSVLTVAGTTLTCRGIGNVAVHPYARGKGYMIDCMNMAISGMIRDGVDFSILGGIRQRYNYYGYESIGPAWSVDIGQRDTNYRFDRAGIPFPQLELHRVSAGEEELIDRMYTLHQTRPLRTQRSREKFLDICRSWHQDAVAILRRDECIGYYVGDLQELTLANDEDFDDVVRSYVARHGKVTMQFADWETDHLRRAAAIGSAPVREYCDMFNIFNYKKVLTAFLGFKASLTALPDGEMTVTILGSAGTEHLRIAVEKGVPAVTDAEGPTDLTLEHLEAMTFFFGLYSPRWEEVAPAVRSWFPLPLYVDRADHV